MRRSTVKLTKDEYNARHLTYNNDRVNVRKDGKRKRTRYNCNHPVLPHFENSHLYSQYLYATIHIISFTFSIDGVVIGIFRRTPSGMPHRYYWKVEKDFTTSKPLFHGKQDVGRNHVGEIVKPAYLLDYMGIKLWASELGAVTVTIHVIDNYRGKRWIEQERDLTYKLTPRSKNKYDLQATCDDRGLESLKQVYVEHSRRKSQVHKCMKQAYSNDEWDRWKRMKHADEGRKYANEVIKHSGKFETIDYSQFKRVEK